MVLKNALILTLMIITVVKFDPHNAGVVQWQNTSFPSWVRGFDSLHPLKTNPI